MKILKYLMENYEIDDNNDAQAIFEDIKAKFNKDDVIELANAVVLINELPQDLFNKIYELM